MLAENHDPAHLWNRRRATGVDLFARWYYIENIGSAPVRVINVFNSRLYEDASLNQWMALTPPDLVKGHLNLDDAAMRALRRDYRPVVR